MTPQTLNRHYQALCAARRALLSILDTPELATAAERALAALEDLEAELLGLELGEAGFEVEDGLL